MMKRMFRFQGNDDGCSVIPYFAALSGMTDSRQSFLDKFKGRLY